MTSIAPVLWAEARKLLSRPVARLALLFTVGIGVFGPLALWFLGSSSITWNNQPLGESLDRCAANGLRWALVVRGFLLAQILLSVLSAVSLAGELQARTLRDDLVRPVARWQVLGAKWAALCAWSGLSMAGQLAVGGFLGVLLLGAQGETEWRDVLLGYAAIWVAETSFAALALASAVWIRSVAGTFVVLVLALLIERFVTWAGWGMRSLMTMGGGTPPIVFELLPFTPSSAWSTWSEFASGTSPSWEPGAALLLWTTLAAVLGLWRFSRMDVP